jgi:hypothetical protein
MGTGGASRGRSDLLSEQAGRKIQANHRSKKTRREKGHPEDKKD